MTDSSDKYLRTKIFLAKVSGVVVLFVSMQFSQNGFGFKNQEIAYAGWVLAVAVTVAQLIFNSKVKNLNWTITTLGIMAYGYSIWTNIVGFYSYQGEVMNLMSVDAILPVLGSIFLDVFPETALAWAFNASTDGDLIGNILAVGNDPDNIFKKRAWESSSQPSKSQPSSRPSVPPPSSLPRNEPRSSGMNPMSSNPLNHSRPVPKPNLPPNMGRPTPPSSGGRPPMIMPNDFLDDEDKLL